MELFDRIHREGKNVIFVTHDPGVAEHADRLIRIEDGGIKSDKRKREQESGAGGNCQGRTSGQAAYRS